MLNNSSSRFLALIAACSVILNLALWLLAYYSFPATDAAVLHYSIGIGIDFIGPGSQIYMLPAIGLIILVGNTILGTVIRLTDNRSAWLLWSIIPLTNLVLIGSFFFIWRANQ